MSINIETAALSMSESLDSLKATPLIMHRIYFKVANTKGWYALHTEAKLLFARNYRSQSGVKRRLDSSWFVAETTLKNNTVWFDVPDPNFGTWCTLKCVAIVVNAPGK